MCTLKETVLTNSWPHITIPSASAKLLIDTTGWTGWITVINTQVD